MLQQRELTFDDISAILRRRWLVIALPAVLGPFIALGIAFELPSRYTSQTLVLVEQQKVPDSYVRSVITEDIGARIGTMREQILSRTRLQPIIERFGLFKEEAGRKPMEELVERMRKSINVIPVRSVTTSAEEDRRLPGFYLSFTAPTPRLAQQVCQEITSMFIEENLRLREQTAQGTTSFLETQLEDAKRKLDEQDGKLAQFKRKYMGELPDETQTNLNVLASLNTQLQAATQALNRAQVDKAFTESLLTQQLNAWEATKSGKNPHPETVQEQLRILEDQLVLLESRYTSDHPDIIKTKAMIEEYRKKAHEAQVVGKTTPAAKTPEPTQPEPPQIQQLRMQLHSEEATVQEYSRQQARLQQDVKLYQSRVQLSPGIEQEYKIITRDYQTALGFYNELLAKKNQSAMATDLERRQQGEQFSMMDPPNLPETPSFPNRPLFAAGGLGGGLALGLGLVLLLEIRDKSLRTDRDIEFYLGLPTLSMVPTIANGNRRKRNLGGPAKKQKPPAAQPLGV